VSVKKAKGKGKSTATKAAANKDTSKAKKALDVAEVRENISDLVKASAALIAASVIEVATRTGQLASAKYLFESVGIYPATEQTEERAIETTMAHQLLTRMGIPLEPVVCDEDSVVVVTSAVKVPATKAAETAGENSEEEREEEQLPAEGEE
jgi:hypothetical protein